MIGPLLLFITFKVGIFGERELLQYCVTEKILSCDSLCA